MRRLIPAHAGKTTGADGRPRGTWAHPRSRGENLMRCRTLVAASGSSPLTRGKLRPERHPQGVARLIPAHAGKTVKRPDSSPARPAHPRSRGENGGLLSHFSGERGSSPLTRGKPGVLPGRDRRGRLIPAHAEKTSFRSVTATPTAAHPRSRGENTVRTSRTETFKGSSPLTRGKLVEAKGQGHRFRLIPAHAGKTLPAPQQLPAASAHPRSRGENRSW